MIHGNWLAKWARFAPEKEALVELDSGRSWTYLDLDRRADRAAQMLAEQLGVGRGDRVAVLAGNRPEQIELLFAAAKLGALLVPINWRLAPDEVAWILGDCGPKVLIHDADLAESAEAITSGGLWAGPVMSIDDNGPDGYEARLDRAPSAPVTTEGVEQDTPLMLLYTSGTTGRPKGAILTHGSITWNAINTATCWDLHGNDVTVTHTPLFHTGGWNVLTLPLLHRGATVVLARKFDPGATLRALGDHGVTLLFAVPTMFQMMLDDPGFAEARFDSVRFFISGGAPCPIPLIEAFSQRCGVVFKQGYGLTEVGPNCFVLDERDAVRKAGSVGFPVIHLDTRVVDDQSREVGADQVGELELRGPTVCAGYWRNPEATAAATAAGGWFRTGDLFRVDDEGYHWVVGRLKEMFISGGENVYPAEVERVLHELIPVVGAAVVGTPDDRWGEVGAAFVALAPGASRLSAEQILEHCRGRLAKYKVPKTLTILDELPTGSSGKIDKLELARRAREG